MNAFPVEVGRGSGGKAHKYDGFCKKGKTSLEEISALP